MTQPLDQRTGPGRWTPTRTPKGVLWTNDTTATGYQPGPGVDPAAVTALLELTPGTPTEVFDTLAERIGTKIAHGSLDTWTADRA